MMWYPDQPRVLGRAPAELPVVVMSERCLRKEAGGQGNWETVPFVPNTCWYLPHWTLVRSEFMKSIENNAHRYSGL